jgi:small ligand-binding sensory domain FIST
MTSIQTANTTNTNASIRCSAAASTATSLYEAISTAYQEALEQLGAPLPDLVVVFVSASYGDEIRAAMESLNEIAPARYLLGTTAEAVLANNEEYESEPAISIWMAQLPNAEITPLTLEYSQTADGGTFLGWPEDLVWPTDATMLLLADPFSFPVDGLIARLGRRSARPSNTRRNGKRR